MVLVALKCDLRTLDDDADEEQRNKEMIQYDQGLKVAQQIKALRYLGECLFRLRFGNMSKNSAQ